MFNSDAAYTRIYIQFTHNYLSACQSQNDNFIPNKAGPSPLNYNDLMSDGHHHYGEYTYGRQLLSAYYMVLDAFSTYYFSWAGRQNR